MSRDSIIVFEDDNDNAQILMKALRNHLRGIAVDVLRFPVNPQVEQEEPLLFETRISDDLRDKKAGNVSLIVCDRDLSGTSDFRGLSEAAVSKVADDLSVPVCLYARAMKGTVIDRAQEWRNRQIVMDFTLGYESMGRTAASIYKGFKFLIKKAESYFKAARSPKTPAEVLARALSRPKISDRLALYGAGDLANLAEVFQVKKGKQEGDRLLRTKSMAKLLGLWLYNSIMRFPGILVNPVAAASYLELDEKSFNHQIVQTAIDPARYEGPFTDTGHFWWRDRLDEIVHGKGFQSGFEMFRALHPHAKWKPATCHVDGKPPAGFYCMFREKPVSERNSRGNITWFPSGADLARLTISDFEELAPWVGLY